MSRLALLFAIPALTLVACFDKGGSDDDDDDDGGSDTAIGWGGVGGGSGGEGSGGEGSGGEGSGGEGSGGEGSGGEGSEGGGSSGSGSGSASTLPDEGTWVVNGYEVLSDPCGLTAFQDPGAILPATMTVEHTGSSTFEITSEGGAPSECSVSSGGGYSCDASTTEQGLDEFGLDATMVIETSLSGAVSGGGSEMSATTTVEVTCDGPDCSLLGSLGISFPCTQEIGLDLDPPS